MLRRYPIKKDGAFTLIEIMVVIAIIAILTGIIGHNIMKARAEAKLQACVQNLKTIATAINTCMIRHPEAFMGASNNEHLLDDNDILIVEGYLAEVPHCPNGSLYSYKVGGSVEGTVYRDYFHVSHHNQNCHKDCGLKTWYPYYRADRGICYKDFKN